MPRVKYKEFVEKLKRSSVFTYKQVESVLGKNYAKLWIHKMVENGKIVKLLKGWYTFKPSPYLVTIPLGKSYIGLGSAAFLHGAWNQITNIHVLSPTGSVKIRTGEREICGFKIIIKKISERMYFGYTRIFLEDVEEWIRVSDREKTFIDIVHYNYPFSDEILPGLLEDVDVEKIREYLKIMKKRNVRGWRRTTERIEKILERFR